MDGRHARRIIRTSAGATGLGFETVGSVVVRVPEAAAWSA
jgi:hypothetical protein